MTEARQICRSFDQLHADKLAAERQNHLSLVSPMIDRQVMGRLGCVRLRIESARVSPDCEEEFRPEGMGRTRGAPKFMGFDIRSAPMAKYPRMCLAFRVK